MLSDDELPEEAKKLSLHWMVDPATGKRVKPRRWVHDPATGEFYRLMSLQRSGPELQRYSYVERLEQRIAQEKELNDKIKSAKILLPILLCALAIVYFGWTHGYIFLIFAAPGGALLFYAAWAQFVELISSVGQLKNEDKMIDVGPKPIKRFDFSGLTDKHKEMSNAAASGSSLPLWPVPPSPEPEKKGKWDVGR